MAAVFGRGDALRFARRERGTCYENTPSMAMVNATTVQLFRSGKAAALDHLVGTRKKLRLYCETERPGCTEIDDQFELGWQLDQPCRTRERLT
jgi:hypothetical protein